MDLVRYWHAQQLDQAIQCKGYHFCALDFDRT